MSEATFKFLIENQQIFFTIFDTCYGFFIMIFVLFLCFGDSIYFGLVSLDELQQYAYPIFQSTYSDNHVVYGFMDFMMGVWAGVCDGLAGIWQGFGVMGLDLAQVWQGLRNNI